MSVRVLVLFLLSIGSHGAPACKVKEREGEREREIYIYIYVNPKVLTRNPSNIMGSRTRDPRLLGFAVSTCRLVLDM
jgi:hypothetical protein